jgi:cation transport regulator
MPYSSLDDLPPRIQRTLPPHAQEIYRAAFNHAWEEYSDRLGREKLAHQVAWAAVKRVYEKDPQGQWARKTGEA